MKVRKIKGYQIYMKEEKYAFRFLDVELTFETFAETVSFITDLLPEA